MGAKLNIVQLSVELHQLKEYNFFTSILQLFMNFIIRFIWLLGRLSSPASDR